jgi:uncharacterized protein (TIGR00730 family)
MRSTFGILTEGAFLWKFSAMGSLKEDLANLVDRLSTLPNGDRIERALTSILRLADADIERLDWKILSAAIEDMEKAFQMFYPYRRVRKVAVFGSARTPQSKPEYTMALEFAKQSVDLGWMVITGAGGGIMGAANEGAGKEDSFGLNIQLPYEQGANEFINKDLKLMSFKYFFTRKLFFLRESDAIALFPGGFGTHDEALECLTLCQTGRYGPVPMVLIAPPGSTYWKDWDDYVVRHLVANELIDPEDRGLYKITDSLEEAHQVINDFYRTYHSSRYVGELLVLRLHQSIGSAGLAKLNEEFADILTEGLIEASTSLPEESGDSTANLPRLVLHFNQRKYGRLYQLIRSINGLCLSDACSPLK